MKRIVALTLTALLGVAVLAIAQSDVITLDYGSKLFKPTQFKHKFHVEEQKVVCDRCHHTGEQVGCGTCHKVDGSGDAPKARDAFHNLCRKCHQEKRNEGKEPPVSCTGCHEKK